MNDDTYAVHYTNKRGAGCTHWFGEFEDTLSFILKLRFEARVTLNGEQVGGVEYCPDRPFDDKRIKWFPWIWTPEATAQEARR